MSKNDSYATQYKGKQYTIKKSVFNRIVDDCELKSSTLRYSYLDIKVVFVPGIVYRILRDLSKIDLPPGVPDSAVLSIAYTENNTIIIDTSTDLAHIPHQIMHEILHIILGYIHYSDNEMFVGQLDLPIIELILNNLDFFKILKENNYLDLQFHDEDVMFQFKEYSQKEK